MWDRDSESGVVGVSYGKRSNAFPDVRRVSFDNFSLNDSQVVASNENTQQGHDKAYIQPGALPKLEGLLKGQTNPVYQADEINPPLDADNGYGSVSSKGDDNSSSSGPMQTANVAVDIDKDDDVSHHSSQKDSIDLDDIDGMFDV